jgi:hypothetical protein
MEKIKRICEHYIQECDDKIQLITEEENTTDIDNILYKLKINFEDKYKSLYLKNEWTKFLTILNSEGVDGFKLYFEAIKLRILGRVPCNRSTNEILNICSLYEFECLQFIYKKLNVVVQNITKN